MTEKKAERPMIDEIIEWEMGEMDGEREKEFFERIVSSGLVYQLQGAYGRKAHDLGLI